ncbi:hypothetical protein BDR22DRAFT_975661 [Usnea florida]
MSSAMSLFPLFATIFAMIFPLINGAMVERSNITSAAPASAATPQISATPALLGTPVTSPVAPTIYTDPAPSSAGCAPWATCNLFYPSVTVYYWPEGPQNTACLSANPLVTSTLTGIPNIQSPSVYVVFPTVRGYDGCSRIGDIYFDLTTSFAPGALSTIRPDSTTYSFNFGDLPCPPADVQWDFSNGSYAPQVAPPDFLFDLDPAFKTCIPGLYQGIDPPMTLTQAAADSGPGAVGCPRGQCHGPKRAIEHAHPMPWAPQRTTEPTS